MTQKVLLRVRFLLLRLYAGMVKMTLDSFFMVDEELASTGAQLANKHPMASQCEFLINGEPTDNLVAVGTKGSSV